MCTYQSVEERTSSLEDGVSTSNITGEVFLPVVGGGSNIAVRDGTRGQNESIDSVQVTTQL